MGKDIKVNFSSQIYESAKFYKNNKFRVKDGDLIATPKKKKEGTVDKETIATIVGELRKNMNRFSLMLSSAQGGREYANILANANVFLASIQGENIEEDVRKNLNDIIGICKEQLQECVKAGTIVEGPEKISKKEMKKRQQVDKQLKIAQTIFAKGMHSIIATLKEARKSSSSSALLSLEGIFRQSTNFKQLEEAVNEIRNADDVAKVVDRIFQNKDAIFIACVLKNIFRNLENPLIPDHTVERLKDALEERDPEKKTAIMKNAIRQLPQVNRRVLRECMKLLHSFTLDADLTKMASSNLAIVWSQNFAKLNDTSQINTLNSIIQMLIDEANKL